MFDERFDVVDAPTTFRIHKRDSYSRPSTSSGSASMISPITLVTVVRLRPVSKAIWAWVSRLI